MPSVIIGRLADLLVLLIIVRAVISWVPEWQRSRLAEPVYRLTEPLLAPLRRLLPLPGLDISPLLAIILIRLLRSMLGLR